MTERPQLPHEHHEMVLNMRDGELDVQDMVKRHESLMAVAKTEAAEGATVSHESSEKEDDIRTALSKIITRLFILRITDPHEIALEERKLHELGIDTERYKNLSKDELPLPSAILTDFLTQWERNKGEAHEK